MRCETSLTRQQEDADLAGELVVRQAVTFALILICFDCQGMCQRPAGRRKPEDLRSVSSRSSSTVWSLLSPLNRRSMTFLANCLATIALCHRARLRCGSRSARSGNAKGGS